MWSAMKKVYYEEQNETLLQVCVDTHQQATKNSSSFKVLCAYIHPKILGFRNDEYFPLRVDIITCKIEEKTENGTAVRAFHITEGRRPDCVYYVEPAPAHVVDVHYVLGKLVCDIPLPDDVEHLVL